MHTSTDEAEKKNPPLPPGPLGLPILGYLSFLGNNLFQKFTDLRHKYGTLFRISLRNKLCVVKEVVRDQDSIFTNRDIPTVAIVATYGTNDVVFSQLNPKRRAMRKVFAPEMMNIKSLDSFYDIRKDHDEKTIEIGPLIFRTELKVMMNMLWGGKFIGEEGEWIASEFLVVTSKIVDLFGKPDIFDFFPVLAGLNIQGVTKHMNHNLCDEKCE